MFLRPHHFQAAERYGLRVADQNTRFAQWHAWGYRRCVIDEAALGGFRLVVRELDGRFRDGTILSMPADAPLPDIDLKPAFQGKTVLDVSLGIPVIRSTPTGISAVVDAHGQLVHLLPWQTAGVIDAILPPPLAPTLFARLGNIIPLALGFLLLIAAIALDRRRRYRQT